MCGACRPGPYRVGGGAGRWFLENSTRSVAEPGWTIGAVARATGLSPDTLRVWQKRYGFPVPRRKPSGHRLFTGADVRRLRRISEALARGHRPGQVVPLTEPRLESLLTGAASAAEASRDARARIRTLLDLVQKQRGAELATALLTDAASLGPVDFLKLRAAPMIHEIGEAWARGDLGIRHEHAFSERMGDVLRRLRVPFETAAAGPRILLATLPGETHGLGLQMASVLAAFAGLQPELLGTDTPVPEIVAAARTRRHAAVGVSVSISTGGAASRDRLVELRRGVPSALPILVGGAGARRSHPPGGCVIVDDLDGAHDWMRRLALADVSPDRRGPVGQKPRATR
jgi:DNA-binding transcriptional MerR regulator/methylmalonyl-CoA mutase cobalamin-binding subunit